MERIRMVLLLCKYPFKIWKARVMKMMKRAMLSGLITRKLDSIFEWMALHGSSCSLCHFLGCQCHVEGIGSWLAVTSHSSITSHDQRDRKGIELGLLRVLCSYSLDKILFLRCGSQWNRILGTSSIGKKL